VGPIDSFLRTARSRVMTPAEARPHHLRFVLLMIMSLSPFALAGNQYLLELLRGLGAPYDPPAASFVRGVLLHLLVNLKNELPRSKATRSSSGNPAAADLLGRVHKIPNSFHKSSASFEMLNSVPFPGDAEPRKLITESPGRWGSTYVALVRLFTLMPRMIGLGDLHDLTVAQWRQLLGRDDWGQLRHLIGVLQPAYEACIAFQSSTSTVADAFTLVCSLRRTMRLSAFPCPKAFDKPYAVSRDDILKFLEEDVRQSDVMELDNRC